MSSILKALKKLESETSKAEGGKFPALTIASKKAAYSRDKKVRWFGVYLPIFCSALILCVVGWAVIYNKPAISPPPLPSQPLSGKPASPPAVFSPPLPKAVPQEKKEEIHLPVKKETAGKELAETSVESPPKEDIESSGPPEKEMLDAPPVAETSPEEKTKIKTEEKPPPTIHSPPLDPADDSWLKLQAISWTEDPKNRIAVINNRIVREGGAVEDGLILQIEKDFVVVEGKGQKWRLGFRLNQ